MKKIAIIGCGFSGTMTAVHLIKNAAHPIELILIGDHQNFNTGIAYNPYSKKQLLNVVASRMSAFQDNPDDFTNWVSKHEDYPVTDKGILANTYLPRYLYGQYLKDIWKEALQQAEAKNIQIRVKDAQVLEMDVVMHEVTLILDNGDQVTAQYCVIATGNNLPGNPKIENTKFYESPKYFRNPWEARSVANHDPNVPILILGNGLTMADTVLGLLENGFGNKIYTLSPHGFTILPHRHHGVGYSAVKEEIHGKQGLHDLVRIMNKHIKITRELGFTAEPVIDAIRPLTHQLWQNLTNQEKCIFMARLRYLWDSTRHRIPMHIHDRIRQLTETGKLIQHAGILTNITETENYITAFFFDRKRNLEKEIVVSAVINCTGPDQDFMKYEKSFLNNCVKKGTVVQDELKLGIIVDPVTFEVRNGHNEPQSNILAIGSLLRGVLWESTAVKELREQAENLAFQLANKLEVNLPD